MTSSSSTLKLVCNKDQVSLFKDVINAADKTYKIVFNAHNDGFPISTMVGFKMYTLLYELNRDIIHSFKVIKENYKSIEMVFLFKPVGKEFGIAPKFMHTITKTDCTPQHSCCIFNSVDVCNENDDNISIPKKYERLHTNNSVLTVHLISNNELHFDFTFSLKDNNDNNDNNQNEKNEYPIYMENSVALMIKKMFCRLKVFTERIA